MKRNLLTIGIGGILSAVLIVVYINVSGTQTSGTQAIISNVSDYEDQAKNSGVYVESEFAPLKRVVLTQSEIELKDEFGYSKEDMDRWVKEREELEKVLKAYNVEVIKPRLLTDDEKKLGKVTDGVTGGEGVSNSYVRDPFFTIGNHLIEGAMIESHRRIEVLTARDILSTESAKAGVQYVSCPQPDISVGINTAQGAFLEGGDVMIYGKKIFVGNSGAASNEDGIKWLQNYLKPWGYEVIEVKLKEDMLHLDCALSLVREGLIIACPDAFINGIPEEFKNWDTIVVSMDDALELATNGLPVNESVYITDVVFKDTVGAELEKRGIKVEYIDFSVSRDGGGAFHCSTQPLLRVSE